MDGHRHLLQRFHPAKGPAIHLPQGLKFRLAGSAAVSGEVPHKLLKVQFRHIVVIGSQEAAAGIYADVIALLILHDGFEPVVEPGQFFRAQ